MRISCLTVSDSIRRKVNPCYLIIINLTPASFALANPRSNFGKSAGPLNVYPKDIARICQNYGNSVAGNDPDDAGKRFAQARSLHLGDEPNTATLHSHHIGARSPFKRSLQCEHPSGADTTALRLHSFARSKKKRFAKPQQRCRRRRIAARPVVQNKTERTSTINTGGESPTPANTLMQLMVCGKV